MNSITIPAGDIPGRCTLIRRILRKGHKLIDVIGTTTMLRRELGDATDWTLYTEPTQMRRCDACGKSWLREAMRIEYVGLIGNVALFDRQLTGDEIDRLYRASK